MRARAERLWEMSAGPTQTWGSVCKFILFPWHRGYAISFVYLSNAPQRLTSWLQTEFHLSSLNICASALINLLWVLLLSSLHTPVWCLQQTGSTLRTPQVNVAMWFAPSRFVAVKYLCRSVSRWKLTSFAGVTLQHPPCTSQHSHTITHICSPHVLVEPVALTWKVS